MRRGVTALLALGVLIGTAGCVRTVATVVTAPVRVTGKVIDWSTTSPSERDRKYTREMRKREERCRKHPDREECAQGGYAEAPPR
ncbi:MAG: hypothetical protein P0Y64_02865 [Candidatus Sphingomonas colombiensis]|nr:hypothetical protein [Sphingomonas sp.]WEK43788.1 MAG: hypothetical protein P0Y64_02865 [Sphingomonas sp.]